MATLYEILKEKKLKNYPPLPDWVKNAIKVLGQDEDSGEYYEFTESIIYDPKTKTWTRSTEQ
jgi:hypothetical protein